MKKAPTREFRPGRTYYLLDGQPVTEEEARAWAEAKGYEWPEGGP